MYSKGCWEIITSFSSTPATYETGKTVWMCAFYLIGVELLNRCLRKTWQRTVRMYQTSQSVKHYPSWPQRRIHANIVNFEMAVGCLQNSPKVTDILSYKEKQTDRIIQLNCNRNSPTPSLAEDYANKLLPAVLCGVPPPPPLSLITLHSCGPSEWDWQTNKLDVVWKNI